MGRHGCRRRSANLPDGGWRGYEVCGVTIAQGYIDADGMAPVRES